MLGAEPRRRACARTDQSQGRGNLARYSGHRPPLVSFIKEDIGMFSPPSRAALLIFTNNDSKPYAGATGAVSNARAVATCAHPVRRALSEPVVAEEQPRPVAQPPSRNTLAQRRPMLRRHAGSGRWAA